MGATEDGFDALARAQGINLVRRATFPGLSNLGHADPTLADTVSSSTLVTLEGIYNKLGGERSLLERKRHRLLEIDFYAPELELLIEVDETQHFTSDRRSTLERYPRGDGYAALVPRYFALIDQWRQRADRYRASKPAADFPHTGGRRRQRAYLDSVRDLLVPELGLLLLRVPAPECDPALAFQRFERDALST